MNELIRWFTQQDPIICLIIIGIIFGGIVGIFKYIAYMVKGDPNIIANGDDDE